jgi:hypothetical protein
LADEAILILSQGAPFKEVDMPVEVVNVEKKQIGKKADQVEPKGIPAEVIANGPFSRLNQPNRIKMNPDGSLYVCFGKRRAPDDKQSRDYQFYLFLLKPEMEKEELDALVEAWYQLRSSRNCKQDFYRVNGQILDLISRPACVKEKEGGYLLRPIETGAKIEASLVLYTSFEDDKDFVLPENTIEKPLHGRFNKDGHVVAFVTNVDQRLTFVTRNGAKVELKIKTLNGEHVEFEN